MLWFPSGLTAGLLLAAGVAGTQALGAQASWTLEEEPSLVIGLTDGPSPLVFHDIRGALIAEDTLIVVADGGSSELRVFSLAGDLLTTFGGRGDGPREFRSMAWADGCGMESVTVYDFHRRRVTRWTPRGTLLEEFSVESPAPDRPPYALHCGPGGQFAVVAWFDVLGHRLVEGPYRPETRVGVLDPGGRVQRVLGDFPGPERYRFPGERLSDGPRPLGKNTIARMGAAGVLVGTAEQYRIQVFRHDGTSFSFGRSEPPLEPTPAMIRAWLDSVLVQLPAEDRPAARRALERFGAPSTLPAYEDFRFADDGSLWVARFPPPGQVWLDWDVWEVGETRAQQVATLRVPRDFRPTHFSRDALLGVHTGALGTQTVRRFGILR